MSDALYVLVTEGDAPADEPGEWIRAEVILNSTIVSTGWCPVTGVYKSEGTARKSAVSLAINSFAKKIGRDVRDASPTGTEV